MEWLPDIPIPPAIESPYHPDSVGSYGRDFVEWVRTNLGEEPRPWQAYVAGRVLEHDSGGALVYRRVGISVPRQVGKSVLLRQLAAWRMHRADLFGEPQTVLHVAHSLNTTEEVFAPAIEWARRRPGMLVRTANGQQRLEWEGSRWLPRSTQTGYGFTLSLALVDEAWAVAERRVNSGYGPTLSERRSGQVVMFSSANEEATPLFPRFREAAMERAGWLLLEWSAQPGADAGDRDVWQAATPVPLEEGRRLSLMADEWTASADTFRFERLNIWPAVAGLSWGERVAARLPGPSLVPGWSGPLSAGLESDLDGSGWGAAVSDGSHVEVVHVARLGEALSWLSARQPVRVLMHESAAKQLELSELLVVKVSASDAAAATAVLRDAAGGLSWSGVLGEQLRSVQVSTAGGVEKIDAARSSGPVSGVKAGAWALWSARTAPAEIAAIY